MEKIKVNGKVYQAKELDFNFLCELGDQNIQVTEISKKIFPAVRVYVAFCMDVDVDVAGDEINKHVINGGDFNEIIEVFNQKAENSGFFQALGKTAEKNTETSSTETPKKRNTKKSEPDEI